jgi:hypothetical protein
MFMGFLVILSGVYYAVDSVTRSFRGICFLDHPTGDRLLSSAKRVNSAEKQMRSKISDENLTDVLRMMDFCDEEYERLLETQECPLAEAEMINDLLQEECSAYCWYEVLALPLEDRTAVHDWVHDLGSVIVNRLPHDDETRSELYAVANELIQIRTKLIECLGGHAVQN